MFSLSIQGTEVTGLARLRQVMERQLAAWDGARDHRAAFLRVYYTMTSSVAEKVDTGYFLDPAWIERVAVRFAWWYFDALERFEQGRRTPPAWAYAFDMARRHQGFLMQDVLLGMNAHINNDLPMVVEAILRTEGDATDPFRSTRRRYDHDQINRVLHEIIPHVENEIAQHNGRLIRPLGRLLGRLDGSLTAFGLRTYRDNVWRNAQFLLACHTDAERTQVIRFIEEDALAVAKSVAGFAPLAWVRPLAPLMRRWRLC